MALQHVAELRLEVAELTAIADTLEELADKCSGSDRPDCPILKELAGEANPHYNGAGARGRGIPGQTASGIRNTLMSVTIYHNPACGTSRNVLALIRNSGQEPQVVEYLKTPPTREELLDLIRRMDIPVRDLLRKRGNRYDELGLNDPALTDDQLVDAMIAHPILINRPIVVSPLGVRLCRPSEAVLNILPDEQGGPFNKEDGEPVIDNQGRRVDKRNRS